VAEFVRRNAGAVLGLLPESVKACARKGLVSLDVVAGDGTKLKANAAMAGNLTREQLDAQVSELEAWIGAELRQWAAGFLGPGEDPGDGDAGGDGPGDGKRKWKRKPARAGRKEAALARWEAKAARYCRQSDGS